MPERQIPQPEKLGARAADSRYQGALSKHPLKTLDKNPALNAPKERFGRLQALGSRQHVEGLNAPGRKARIILQGSFRLDLL